MSHACLFSDIIGYHLLPFQLHYFPHYSLDVVRFCILFDFRFYNILCLPSKLFVLFSFTGSGFYTFFYILYFRYILVATCVYTLSLFNILLSVLRSGSFFPLLRKATVSLLGPDGVWYIQRNLLSSTLQSKGPLSAHEIFLDKLIKHCLKIF